MRALMTAVLAIGLCGCATLETQSSHRQRMVMILETGSVEIELRPDKAPRTVAHLRDLARHHFYDGLSIVRIAPGHVVQAGDPNFDGTGGSGQTVPLEVSDLRHVRGAVGIARNAEPNSGDSQFYICLADRPQLDRRYTVIGYVVQGMDVIDRLALTPGNGPRGFITDRSKQPRIIRVRAKLQ